MLANRLRKNARKLHKWRGRQRIDAYRLYDRDIPEIALAVDRYGAFAQVAEYRRDYVDRPSGWLDTMLDATAEALNIARENVILKQRQRQKGTAQYEKLAQPDPSNRFTVNEGDVKLLVDLHSYLDTGLFLDHRPLRQRLAKAAVNKRVLNLFCYTGSFTVHAAAAGARGTTSVDLSHTYLAWAQENLALNGLEHPRHELVQADVLSWLRERAGRERYDLAIVDPPTFSNSKRTQGTFDVQRDHAKLCLAAAALLKPGATLWFSTNLRSFKLNLKALADLLPRDITVQTIPRDFRDQKIHNAWQMNAML